VVVVVVGASVVVVVVGASVVVVVVGASVVVVVVGAIVVVVVVGVASAPMRTPFRIIPPVIVIVIFYLKVLMWEVYLLY
jgi:hypothetical protein